MKSRQSLKAIRFEDELLPDWAQLLDLAASLSSVPESTRQWFSLFTRRTGVDDARTIIEGTGERMDRTLAQAIP